MPAGLRLRVDVSRQRLDDYCGVNSSLPMGYRFQGQFVRQSFTYHGRDEVLALSTGRCVDVTPPGFLNHVQSV